MTISEEDLRGLSAAERETLLDASDNDESGEIAQELGYGTAKDEPAGTATGTAAEPKAADLEDPDLDHEPTTAAAVPANPTSTEATAAALDAAADADAAAAEEDEARPLRAAPADIADQRTALATQEDDSMQKLLDGEITQAEHSIVKNEVRSKLDALLIAEASDTTRDNIVRDSMMKMYQGELKSTIALGKAAGLDYTDATIGAQFDRAVRMFSQQLGEDGISDKPGKLDNSTKALEEAHAYMLRRNGKTAPAAAAAPAAKVAAVPPGRAAPDRSKLPPTLAAIPTAADASVTSEFAHLDGITIPADLERALARLTPEQQERYLGA